MLLLNKQEINSNTVFFFFFLFSASGFPFRLFSAALQGFRDPAALTESAMQAAKESPGNRDLREIPGNGAAQGPRGRVTPPCATRRTTSGNSTAKGPTCDDAMGRAYRGSDGLRPARAEKYKVDRCHDKSVLEETAAQEAETAPFPG